MGNEKELNQFRALDFDADDILFSSLVRYHFEREAMEDLEKLNSGEFDAIPEEIESAQKRAKNITVVNNDYVFYDMDIM